MDVIQRSGFKSGRGFDQFLPASGFLFCFGIWISLPWPAKIAGGAWFLVGFLYLVFQTRGFRAQPILMEFTDI